MAAFEKKSHKAASRILIVDDHPIFRRGLADLISVEADLIVCGEAGNQTDAMRRFHETGPELAIVDLALAGGSGLEVIKQISAIDPHRGILVCTMHDESLYGERAILAGADGYLHKQAVADELIVAIRRVLDGGMYLSEELSERIIQSRYRPGETVTEPEARLSDREMEVFGLIGGGKTTKEVAAHLNASLKTVETYRQRIKAKLGLRNASELTQHAVEWFLRSK